MILVMLLNCVPNFSLPFAKHLTYVANHWKKNCIFLTCLCYFLSHLYVCNSNAFKNWWWSYWSFLVVSRSLCSNHIYIQLTVFIFFFVVLGLIDEFKRIVCLRKNNLIQHADNCIDGFKTLQNGFGTTFLITFSYHQIENAFCTYMGISSLIAINGNLWQNIVLSVCYFSMTAYFMTILYCITLTAEEAYDALQSLNTPLEKMLVNEDII